MIDEKTMTETPLIILGSARKDGDTHSYTDFVFEGAAHKIIDLLDYKIYPYSYLNDYPDDDRFMEIAALMLQYKTIVFATPVYWYAMSGLMKALFDRFTDLVRVKKEMGRKLSDKSAFLLSIGSDPEMPEGFEIPFRLTCAYLGINYKRSLFFSTGCLVSEEEKLALKADFISSF